MKTKNKTLNLDHKEYEQLLYKLNDSLKCANENFLIKDDHKVKHKFAQKLVSRLFGWYINPIINKQIRYNSEIIHALQNTVLIFDMIQHNTNTQLEEVNIQLEEVNIQLEEVNTQLEYIKSRLNITSDIKLLENSSIDYFDFEDQYRGSREKIKNSQRDYTKYFEIKDEGEVLDIGCGRGEFLELMKENNVVARGVDCYKPFVDFCNKKGFRVEYDDALAYLNNIEDNYLNGIFMSQVIEHISSDYAISLIRTAYRKLKKGCYFILETPNPDNLSTYRNFYLDSSHIKPVHYLTAEYWFKDASYERVERYNNQFSKCPFEIPHLVSDQIENIEQVNKSIDYINKNIFGYYDYTLIARK